MGRPRKRNRRGEGSVYKRSRLWSIVWVEEGIKRYSHGYLDRDAAEQVRASIAANIQAGRPGMKEPPKAPAKTFGALADDWLSKREQDDHRSIADDRRRWKRHLAPILEHRTPDSVSVGFLDNLISDLRKPPAGTTYNGKGKKGISGATAQRVLHLLSAFYTWMIAHGHATANPVREMPKKLDPKALKKRLASTHRPDRTPFLKTKEDIARLFNSLPEPVNIAYALSALIGLRPGEALALRWEDIDLGARNITVERQVRHGREGIPKSGKGRKVDIVPSLHATLTSWRDKNPSAVSVIPPMRYPGEKGRERGKFLNGRTIKDAMTRAFQSTGIKAMTFYQAGRHTFASQWVLAGLSIYRLQKILGHSSVVVTQRYAHLLDDLTDTELARADVNLAV
jgi:integrase